MKPWKPTKAQLAAAYGKGVRDLIAVDLRVLFCGINPGLYTAAIGRHFGRPGNRFWPAMHLSGFTPRLMSPFESDELLGMGLGITNLVNRATVTADELTTKELVAGGRRLEARLRRWRPRMVAVLGVTSYRAAFGRKAAVVGLQAETIADVATWVLPNPSGLNAHFTLPKLAKVFGELRAAVEDRR